MRTLRAPGIEVNEIDQSYYSPESTLDNPATFAMGFANKGDDYDPKFVYSLNDYVTTFGAPANEAERYLYNAAKETFDNGGLFIAAKLPYKNLALNNFKYFKYDVSEEICQINPWQDLYSTSANHISSLLTGEISSDVLSNARLNIVPDFKNYVMDACDLTEETMSAAEKVFATNKCFVNFNCLMTDQDALSNIALSSQLTALSAAVSDAVSASGEEAVSTLVNSYFAGGPFNKFTRFVAEISAVAGNTPDLSGSVSSAVTDINALLSGAGTCFTDIRGVCDNVKTYRPISVRSDKAYNDLDAAAATINTMTMETYDAYKINAIKPPANSFIIVDISKKYYDKDVLMVATNDAGAEMFDSECLGIVPVVVSPVNAMYCQELIASGACISKYDALNGNLVYATTVSAKTKDGGDFNKNNKYVDFNCDFMLGNVDALSSGSLDPRNDFFEKLVSGDFDEQTVSKTAASYFPGILYKDSRYLNPENLKQIGIVVFAMVKEASNNGQISFVPLESFVGSFDKNAKNETTNATLFIDDVVNAFSKYINVFSNVINASYTRFDTYAVVDQPAVSVGYKSSETKPEISLKTLEESIDLVLTKMEDKNRVMFDVLADAGVSTIAQFIANKTINPEDAFPYNPEADSSYQQFNGAKLAAWRKILLKYKNFCENTRKDCMFIADAPRNLCLIGNSPVVRRTVVKSSVKTSILPNVKYLTGIETSYGTGYVNWLYCYDFRRDEFAWLPPSIKMAGVYSKLMASGEFWKAPAGVTNATLPGVYDVAFNPTNAEAGTFYDNNWNYFVSYPRYGIVAEGQKTFQKNKTAFDRVNVRRTFLGLENTIYRASISYLYEGLTENLISRFNDTVNEIMYRYKQAEAIIDYSVLCNDKNNTPETIDNNELHCSIAVKPPKAVEWIILNFICTNQGADVEEVISHYTKY